MNRFIRMSYGHGGTKYEKILVSVPSPETAPVPLWQRLLQLVAWTVVPVLVCLYALPTSTHLQTIIDISKLELKPPPEPKPPAKREQVRVKPVEPLPEPPPPPVQTIQKPLEKPPEVQVRPEINRPTPRIQEVQNYQPRIAREHARPGPLTAVPSDTRITRNTATSEAPASQMAPIKRARGASGADAPAARERVAPLHRAAAVEGTAGGMATGPRPVARRERSAIGPSGTGETGATRIVARRDRTQAGGTGTEDVRGVASAPQKRISLMTLTVCASPQMEEDAIKAVLGVVGARESCTDQKGLFEFRGTQRISSFNLMITPARGRKPTNRCEELENAYRCLKTR